MLSEQKEKIVVCGAFDSVKIVQPLLDAGWKVKFCIAEQVSATDSSLPGSYGAKGHHVVCGDIVFILSKTVSI